MGFEADGLVIALLVVGAAGVLGSLIGGNLAQRFGERLVLIFSSALNLPCLLLLSFTHATSWSVAISAVSVGLSQAFIAPSASLIARSVDAESRVTRFAFFRIFINVGSIVAPAIVGLVGTNAFGRLFFLSAITSALTALVLVFGLKPVAFSSERPNTQGGTKAMPDNGGSLGIGALLTLLLTMGIAMAIYAQHQSTVPIQLHLRDDGMQIFATLLIINPALIIILEYPLSFLSKRLNWATALGFGVAIMGLGVFTAGVSSPVVLIYFGWVLFTIGECLFAPMSNAAMVAIAPPSKIASFQGYLSAAQSFGIALGPGLGAALYYLSGVVFWWIVAASSVGLLVVVLLLGRRAAVSDVSIRATNNYQEVAGNE